LVEVVLRAIYTASFTFRGINSGVISLVAFKFYIIRRDCWFFARFPSPGILKKTLLRRLQKATLNHFRLVFIPWSHKAYSNLGKTQLKPMQL
jgi:hypothetical protein